jgi:hypothetical protein
MEVVMKNLLIALVVLSSLVSCGKNSVGKTAAGYSALSVTGPTETQLATIVANNQFGTRYSYTYNETFAQAIAQGANPSYSYVAINSYSSAAKTTPPGCHWASIILICNNFSNNYATGGQTGLARGPIANNSLSVVGQQNLIMNLINSRTSIYQGQMPGTFYITTVAGTQYVIDTNYPIQANPVQTITSAGTGEYIVPIQ